MPKISVIIPTYNRSRLIRRCIDSVLHQTFQDFEIIVVDDGSTDNTKEILSAYGNSIRYFFQHNWGPSRARNAGIDQARGDYITFLDSDDFFQKTNLGKKILSLEDKPSMGWTYSDCQYIDENGEYINRGSQRHKYANRKVSGKIFEELLYKRNFIATDTVMIKKSVLEDVGRFDEKICSLEDYDLWLRVSAKYPVHLINEVLVYVTERPNSLSNDFSKWVHGNALIIDKIKNILPNDFIIDNKKLNKMYADKYLFFAQGFIQKGQLKDALNAYRQSLKHFPFQKRIYWLSFLAIIQIFREYLCSLRVSENQRR